MRITQKVTVAHTSPTFLCLNKVNRKVQGMPQSQTAANPRHQEEEKKDKNIHAQNKQTNVRETQRPAPSSPSEVIRMLKQTEIRGQRARENFKMAIPVGGRGQRCINYLQYVQSRWGFHTPNMLRAGSKTPTRWDNSDKPDTKIV